MIIRAGILSDTHLAGADPLFRELTHRAFADCSVIIHAGDLTDRAVLEAFAGKTVYAVHGNMCNAGCRLALPDRRLFRLGRFAVGLAHGDRRTDIEDSLWTEFPEADCIIYGHTHRAVCHREGGEPGVLFLNPGSFRNGSYALLEAGETLTATLHQL